jgi:hypothetical protein
MPVPVYSFSMRTLNVSISDIEYHKFGLTNDVLNFSELIDMVGKELMRQHLDSVVSAAETCGLSSLSMDDIGREVQAVRSHAKSHH